MSNDEVQHRPRQRLMLNDEIFKGAEYRDCGYDRIKAAALLRWANIQKKNVIVLVKELHIDHRIHRGRSHTSFNVPRSQFDPVLKEVEVVIAGKLLEAFIEVGGLQYPVGLSIISEDRYRLRIGRIPLFSLQYHNVRITFVKDLDAEIESVEFTYERYSNHYNDIIREIQYRGCSFYIGDELLVNMSGMAGPCDYNQKEKEAAIKIQKEKEEAAIKIQRAYRDRRRERRICN